MSLEDKIKSGKFAVLGEFEPPTGSDFSMFLKNASLAKGRIDAIVVPEMVSQLKEMGLGGAVVSTLGL